MSANPKIIRGQETRQRLVDAAVAIIEDPSKPMTTKSLLDVAKITKGAVYHHFQSLDELWREAFDAIVRGREVENPYVDPEARSLAEYLSAIGRQFIARLDDEHMQAATWGILIKAVADEHSEYKDLLAAVNISTLNEMVSQGEKFLPAGSDPTQLRQAILSLQGLWLGLLAQAKVDGNYDEKRRILEWYTGVMVDAVQPRAA